MKCTIRNHQKFKIKSVRSAIRPVYTTKHKYPITNTSDWISDFGFVRHKATGKLKKNKTNILIGSKFIELSFQSKKSQPTKRNIGSPRGVSRWYIILGCALAKPNHLLLCKINYFLKSYNSHTSCFDVDDESYYTLVVALMPVSLLRMHRDTTLRPFYRTRCICIHGHIINYASALVVALALYTMNSINGRVIDHSVHHTR